MAAIENESFYTEAPYSYAPSIAEYLATLKVTRNGVIADIMWLDQMKIIKILEYPPDGLIIKLISDADLGDNERLLLGFLKSKRAEDGTVHIKLSDADAFAKTYSDAVVRNTSSIFGSRVPFAVTNSWMGYLGFGFLMNLIFGLAVGMIGMPLMVVSMLLSFIVQDPVAAMGLIVAIQLIHYVATPAVVIFLISYRKLSGSRVERRFLFKEIIVQYLKMSIIYGIALYGTLGFFFVLMPLVSTGFLVRFLSPELSMAMPLLFVPVYLSVMGVYLYYFGKLAYRYLYWLWETPETAENRRKWLEFKEFVIDNSEVEKRPLKHYELWGQFYYYTLAVGGIIKPYSGSEV